MKHPVYSYTEGNRGKVNERETDTKLSGRGAFEAEICSWWLVALIFGWCGCCCGARGRAIIQRRGSSRKAGGKNRERMSYTFFFLFRMSENGDDAIWWSRRRVALSLIPAPPPAPRLPFVASSFSGALWWPLLLGLSPSSNSLLVSPQLYTYMYV